LNLFKHDEFQLRSVLTHTRRIHTRGVPRNIISSFNKNLMGELPVYYSMATTASLTIFDCTSRHIHKALVLKPTPHQNREVLKKRDSHQFSQAKILFDVLNPLTKKPWTTTVTNNI
jgi:hypothetical protein